MAWTTALFTGTSLTAEAAARHKDRERLALGEAPNIAARVQALAAPNRVVITAATRKLIGEQFRLESLGEHVLRGIAQPIELFEVCELQLPAYAATPKPARIIGREADLALLQARFEAANAGSGQIVAISGEAGIGKSCLLRAFRAQLTQLANHWECRCSAYHSHTALYPLTQLLRRTFQIDERETTSIGLANARACWPRGSRRKR